MTSNVAAPERDDAPMELLVQVWRESSRYGELEDALQWIAKAVRGHLPTDLIVLRRIDADHGTLDTLAAGGFTDRRFAGSARRSEIPSTVLPSLMSWFRAGTISHVHAGLGDVLADVLVPRGLGSPCVAGPLTSAGGPVGVVLFVGRGEPWGPAHASTAQALLEPLSVAVANHARLHELARLREALEADKRALLSRLDRQDVADAVVGTEGGLRHVMQRVDQVAATDTPVLLIGETGSGKEVVARTLHARSRRASGPIVRVNCGAIPAGLVDSELFGHERGSFTGAVATRQGWFERADGGTLFLDEVGELPLEAQVRLLRILQDGTFERVGAQKSLTVDVRIIAATHRNLEDMVANGTFREDLWYRLGVFPIRLPPLRDRPEDIPTLATHFARRAGVRLGGVPLVPSSADLETLLAYDWPGNVRELASVIERATILGDGHRLQISAALGVAGRSARISPAAETRNGDSHSANAPHLRSPDRAARAEPPSGPGADVADRPVDADPDPTLDRAMRSHIEAILAATAGRIEGPYGAAVRLRVNPHTLRSRMRKLGIDWSRYRRRPVPR